MINFIKKHKGFFFLILFLTTVAVGANPRKFQIFDINLVDLIFTTEGDVPVTLRDANGLVLELTGQSNVPVEIVDSNGLNLDLTASSTVPVSPFSAAGVEYLQDDTTGAYVVVPNEHYEMHEGDHYFIKTWTTDPIGAATTYFSFTTPAAPERVHAKVKIAPDIDYTINIYEGSVITGGTPIVGINNDRDSVNVAGLTAVAGPTHTTPGTVIWSARNGGGKNPVGVSPGSTYEIIAAANTVYVFELIKNSISSVGVVDIDFWWYEHTPL